MPLGRTLYVILASTLFAACASAPVVQQADMVLTGGAIYTVNPAQPWASAVAIGNGKIVYVGDGAGVEALIGPETLVTALDGKMLMPGFIDSHNHPMAAGTRFLRCNLAGLEWPDETLAALRDCKDKLAPGEWLRGIAMDESSMQGNRPSKSLVDGFTGDTPMVVQTAETKTVWINSAALAVAGIDASTPDPVKGRILREPGSNEPTGVLLGEAMNDIWRLIPFPSAGKLRKALRLASGMANGFGITSSSEASARPGHTDAFHQAENNGELTLRIQGSQLWNSKRGLEQIEELVDKRDSTKGGRFTVGAVKIFLDGSMDQTGAVLQPYTGTRDDFGTLYYSRNALDEIVRLLDAEGIDLHMHAYGDAAVRQGLDAIEHAMVSNPDRSRRHVLAHLALIHADDLPRFAGLGVTANISPLWAYQGEERKKETATLGEPRAGRLLAFESLFDSGALVTAGSDWISESMNPLYGIQVAVTRRPPDGSGPAWNPEQRVSLDPMQIRDVPVLMTLLEGEIVYKAAEESR